jgi:uncharacterized membrane protein YsdA (DUF1294 family)
VNVLDEFSPPVLVACVYGIASAATFVAYGIDKGLAAKGRRRIPEKTLHTMELFGGWPGALAAMSAFRHKSSKLAFRAVTYVIVGLHALGWALYFTR